MIRAIATAAIVALTVTPSFAGKVDIPADGAYGQMCLPTVKCFVSIEKTGSVWKAEFWAVDNKPAGKTLCQFSATLRPGVGTFADGAEFDALVGTVKGRGEVYVAGEARGELRVVERFDSCPEVKLPRSRGIIGFSGGYDPEGDI